MIPRIPSVLRGLRPFTMAVVVAVVVGIAVGAATQALRGLIGLLTAALTARLRPEHGNLALALLPLAGILLAGALQKYVLHRRLDHGTERIADRLRTGRLAYPASSMFTPMAASTLTLGFGGSAGAEGPSAAIGAAVGSWLGGKAGADRRLLRIMVGCGAGAGIAGIFCSPVGGMLFTLEVLQVELSLVAMIALAAACMASALTAYTLRGFTYCVSFLPPVGMSPKVVVWGLVLGVVCGLYAVYYRRVMAGARRGLERMPWGWRRWAVGGAALGLLVFCLPVLYGEGYGALSRIINGHSYVLTLESPFRALAAHRWLVPAVVGALVLAKPLAAAATTCGGGVAGDFAPTLVAGALLGLLVSMGAGGLCGLSVPAGVVAFVAMAGVMAGVVRAPLMAVFISAEMAGGYAFLLPLTLCALVSYGISRALDRSTSPLSPITEKLE